jgi:hypothetical protein
VDIPAFIEVCGLVIQTAHISFVDFREEGQAVIYLGSSNNSITATGETAADLRRFFRRVEAVPDNVIEFDAAVSKP